MRKLPEVEDAKALMVEARNWSVVKWLREKKRVRHAADKANDALDLLEKQVKASWNDELRLAYEGLLKRAGGGKAAREASSDSSAMAQLAAKVKAADDKAYRAHMEAEDTFDKAERILSTSLAREGCRKAIESWDLHEHAIVQAEAGVGSVGQELANMAPPQKR
jgi:hypothetical protein